MFRELGIRIWYLGIWDLGSGFRDPNSSFGSYSISNNKIFTVIENHS